jgi:hypothetical protein
MAKSRPSKSSAKPKKAVTSKASKGTARKKGKSETPTSHAAKGLVRAAKVAVKAVKMAVKAVKADVVKATRSDGAKGAKSINGRKPNDEPAPVKSGAKEPVFASAPQRKAEPIPLSELTPFLRKQKERLVQLRDNMLDSMSGVAKDTLRSRAEGSEASAFGMHQADAGSDAYDRDFALSLLSQEQDALYE